ncbi:hypothetical protein [Rufibacter sp. DG15C]|uniref:hypothetical protein n=1 Tax=Rufibacter sp. DG15C TaxID=1379909 RepID=UPI000B0A6875|nr:hypothetical protein [Rufibacter sp. DG15C]
MKRFLPLISIFVLFILMLSGFAHAQTKHSSVRIENSATYQIPANTTNAIQ